MFCFKNRKWIKYGKLVESKYITVNNHKYYIEVVVLNSYQESINKTFKVVDDVCRYGKIIDSKSDLYDWTSTIVCFQDKTIEVRNIRPENKIIVAESTVPLSISEFEIDNPVFH